MSKNNRTKDKISPMKIILSLLLSVTYLLSTEISAFINKSNCDQIVNKSVYSVCYDYYYKGAKYVGYTLDGDLVNKVNIKKRGRFYTEKNLPKKYRSHPKDYTHTGYDRGHIANDASFDYDIKAMRKTYSMVNIIPQSPKVNRRLWTKVERYERYVASKLGSVTVINGVIYSKNPKRIGRNQISVPNGFWKMIYNDAKEFKKCFYYTNDLDVDIKSDKLKKHQVNCNELEFL